MEKILVVEDNEDMQFVLSSLLEHEGFEAIVTGDGEKALKAVKKDAPHLVLLDIKLPGMDGMQVLEEIRKINGNLNIIMLTAYGDIRNAVQAMKSGAHDYITKPFDNDELILTIRKALRMHHLAMEVERLRKELGEKSAEDIIAELGGESPRIRQVIEYVNVVCPTDMSVIIRGESGTGKELIAHLIHKRSKRYGKPFVAVDCGAIPYTLVESELFGYEKGAFTGADRRKEGRFEQAHEGTLFLDEVTNLTESAQAKLLRVLQEKRLQHLGGKRDIHVDVRIIVASNMSIADAVKKGRFREDLFYRLNEFNIVLPPLRERNDDIPVLTKRFLDEANREFGKDISGFTPNAMTSLFGYRWPGNVRELRNTIRRSVLLANTKDVDTIQFLSDASEVNHISEAHQEAGKDDSLRNFVRNASDEIERDMIIKALDKAGSNKTKAARLLKIDRVTLYAKLKKFGIS